MGELPVHDVGDSARLRSLYKARVGVVDFVTVPEMTFAVVRGSGDPEGTAFSSAVQALYSVSYTAHFIVKKRSGEVTRVMPLEALWWFDGIGQAEGAGALTNMAGVDRSAWHWQAMIAQPEPVTAEVVEQAIEDCRPKHLAALDELRCERWAEGQCAQTLHVGPYADEAPTIDRLHAAIAEAGLRPRGAHHEIYLGDPRRSAPEKLRTLLRQPVEPIGERAP
ncbi:GyrI-like domain-containing protein [Sinomonas sp. JGH33]|uniref:GyrI-like domain-containing protein n=1 Tax=Sinomonas terricola TaxID=3110330 RepID=A0ABU5TAX7_9MICC|nr:GyrI-like domain-containing protein [Sinomonas sp. JGH33]MEA5456838.1 GyrI-like domain-containing protein [Sinomonas sp. JGH33]